MNELVRPPRISSVILERVGYFLPRLLFANTRIAPKLHWGDVTRALDRFNPELVDPASALFWNEWRRRFTVLAQDYEALSASSSSDAGQRSALQSAAAAYHFAEFMFFEDRGMKAELRQSVRRCFLQAMSGMETDYESRTMQAGGETVQTFLFYPQSQPNDAGFPCVILSNGLDSMTEIEILSIGEYLLDRGIAILLFEGPGQGLDLGARPLRIDMEAVVADLVIQLNSQKSIDTRRLGFFGVSFGGYFALRMAEALPDIFSGIVNLSGGPAVAPFAHLPRRLKQDFAFAFGADNPQGLQARFDDLQLADPQTRHGPAILSIHGGLDDIFPAAALETYAALHGKRHDLRIHATEAHVCMNYLHPNLIEASDWMLQKLAPAGRMKR